MLEKQPDRADHPKSKTDIRVQLRGLRSGSPQESDECRNRDDLAGVRVAECRCRAHPSVGNRVEQCNVFVAVAAHDHLTVFLEEHDAGGRLRIATQLKALRLTEWCLRAQTVASGH